jgi:hypothetical protein
MPSRSGRSTAARRSSPRTSSGVDVYLFPAVVGGGLGDVEEVLAAGRRLARAGFRLRLYRRPGSPLPRSVEGPWEWPPHRRVARLEPRAACALTVSPAWGVSAAPARPGPFGRPGPWAGEAEEIERTYGPDHVLHVSLEEFARTLRPREETRERLREGGVPARTIPSRLRAAERAGEVVQFRRAFERFRAFGRPNILPLFATFRPDRLFAREFPAAVQTGPLWPGRSTSLRGNRRRRRRREWVWYASPASAERIAPKVLEGLRDLRPPVHLYVRSPHRWSTVPPSSQLALVTRPLPARAWRRRFLSADLRIVTGSRTLLEALEVGGPFLYFNGLVGSGRRSRRHRPEKIAALLAVGRRLGVPRPLLRDLAEFARGRTVAAVVRRVARRRRGWERLHVACIRRVVPPPYDDAGELLVALARSLAQPGVDVTALVRRVRAGSNP